MTTASPPTTKPLTWLITGCSSGFGLQMARHALAAGHRVIATSRDPSRTPELVSEIEGASPAGRGRWAALDVTASSEAMDALLDKLESEGSQVDVLVNSAGFATAGAAEAFSDAEVRAVFETNFFGAYRLMRACVPRMRRRRAGVVVNLSSGSGLESRESLGLYGASKSALDNVSKTMAREVAPFGVRVLTVYLGSFDTDMSAHVGQAAAGLPDGGDAGGGDYAGSLLERYLGVFAAGPGTFPVHGDHRKAVRAIYDVAVGEGAGAGRGGEIQMVLGRDSVRRAEEVRERLDHMLGVFGGVAANVDRDEYAGGDGADKTTSADPLTQLVKQTPAHAT